MKFLKIILIIITLIALFAFKTFWQAGTFRKITNFFSGTVATIDGPAGAEDITIDQSTGIAFLSSDDRWANHLHHQKPPVRGIIYTLNLKDSILSPVNKTKDLAIKDFHPHGISFYQTPEGKKILFAINHRENGNFIERFEYRNDSLVYLESFADSLLISPNDIVGVGERKFYVSNDHNQKASGGRMIKDVLRIGTGNVVYYDGAKMTATGVKDLKYGNGINVSEDGKRIYVAATTQKKIFFFDRDLSSGILTLSGEIDADTGVDNIELDAAGNLWVGCHPQMLKFLSHAKDETKLSPSQIVKISPQSDGSFKQETIFMDEGKRISASSVGAVYGDKLVIGGVFQRKILVARMK